MATRGEESAEKEERGEVIVDSVKSERIDQRESMRTDQDAITKRAEREREEEAETTATNDQPTLTITIILNINKSKKIFPSFATRSQSDVPHPNSSETSLYYLGADCQAVLSGCDS